MRKKTLIIAEAGVNHNGDMNLAKKMIDCAVDAGADMVKFQTFSAHRQVTRTAKKADYQVVTSDVAESQFEMLQKLELSEQMHHELMEHCDVSGIDFLSTPFDIEAASFLKDIGLQFFKIPSGEITNLPYLRFIGSCNKSVILSTGMSTIGEIESAIDVLEAAGTPRTKVTVLHCTTEYPTPMVDVNLRAMQSIQNAFGVNVGYSDHTNGIEVAVAAVALGASVIEKHFTLDRSMPGPDHQASLEPLELKAMISAIRNIEIALGNGIKRPTPVELKNRIASRKSLVANTEIKSGDVLTADNVTAKRPGSGISPMMLDEVIGRVAKCNFHVDDLIDFSLISNGKI